MNNFLFLLKNSLTVWILPSFVAAVIFNKYNININGFISFINGLVYFYLLLFVITKTNFVSEYKNILINLKYYLLAIISLAALCLNATKFHWEYCILILFVAVSLFICYLIFSIKKSKTYNFNFDIFKNILEISLCASIIFYGVEKNLTKYIVVIGMFEIIYNIICLTVYGYLKKCCSLFEHNK